MPGFDTRPGAMDINTIREDLQHLAGRLRYELDQCERAIAAIDGPTQPAAADQPAPAAVRQLRPAPEPVNAPTCQTCGKEFSSISNLNRHYGATKHGPQPTRAAARVVTPEAFAAALQP